MSLKALARQAIASGGSVATAEPVKPVQVPVKPAMPFRKVAAAIKGKTMGAPSLVLTEAERATVLDTLAKGRPLTLAAWCVGTDPTTMGKYVDSDPDFAAQCKKATGNGLQTLLDSVQTTSRWQSSAWLLERMHPELFALKSDLRSAPNVTVNVQVSKSDCETLAKDFATWIEADSVNISSTDNATP